MPESNDGLEISLDLSGVSVPHLDQYFGVWAIAEDVFRSAVERVSALDLAGHVARHQEPAAVAAASARSGADAPILEGGIALIAISGSMMKYSSSLGGGTSTVSVRRQLRQAAADPEVKAIILKIDSPGGTVSGTQDLANDIAAAAARKPVYGFAEDLCASAGYWALSQATKVFANATALVGSIGTYMVVTDLVGAAAQQGAKVHVIRAGDFKGMGVPGTEITREHLDELQRVTDGLNEHFVRVVAAGRGLSLTRVRELADGRVHIASEAQSLGLIDAVQSFDATVASLRKVTSSNPKGKTTMAESKTIELGAEISASLIASSASYQDLTAAFPKADKDFICSQLDKKATLDEATVAFTDVLLARSEAQAKEIDQLKAAGKKAGAPALTTRVAGSAAAAVAAASFDGDPVAAMNLAVRENLKLGMERLAAVTAVCRGNPGLHRAYLEATNPGRRQRQLIGERFGDE